MATDTVCLSVDLHFALVGDLLLSVTDSMCVCVGLSLCLSVLIMVNDSARVRGRYVFYWFGRFIFYDIYLQK